MKFSGLRFISRQIVSLSLGNRPSYYTSLVRSMILVLCFAQVFFWGKSGHAADQLIIISPHPEGIETAFNVAFKPWYQRETGKEVNVEWIDRGGTVSDFRFIESEFQRVPEGIDIDLVFGGGTDSFMKLADKDLLARHKLQESQLKRIPTELFGIPVYDPEYEWYGAVLSSFGIMYNEEYRQLIGLPEVHTWKDLTHPKVIGQVGAADPRESGSAHMMYEIILQGYGWEEGFEVITKLGGNVRGFSAGSSTIPRDVATGQVIYGMAIDFYAYGKIAEVGADRIKYRLPPDAAVVSPDSIAILKGAPNMPVAQKFLEFVFSDEAQKLWVLKDTDPEGPKWKGGLNRASVIPELYDALGERCVVPNPFKLALTPIRYDAVKGGKRWDIISDLIGALVVDPHKELVSAWKAIGKCKNAEQRKAAIEMLVRLPITEEEVMQMAEAKWNSQDYRNEKLREWGKFATNKFKEAKRMAK